MCSNQNFLTSFDFRNDDLVVIRNNTGNCIL